VLDDRLGEGGSRTAISPSISALRAFSAFAAATISGKSRVQSLPRRLHRVTARRWMRQPIR